MKYKKSIALLALAFTLALVSVALRAQPLRFEVSGSKTSFGWEATIIEGPPALVGKTMLWYNYIADFRRNNVYFFEEWVIEESPGTVLIRGFDEGTTRFANGEFTGNGRVIYADPLTDWVDLIGYKEHISGTVDFVDPADPMTWTFTATVTIH